MNSISNYLCLCFKDKNHCLHPNLYLKLNKWQTKYYDQTLINSDKKLLKFVVLRRNIEEFLNLSAMWILDKSLVSFVIWQLEELSVCFKKKTAWETNESKMRIISDNKTVIYTNLSIIKEISDNNISDIQFTCISRKIICSKSTLSTSESRSYNDVSWHFDITIDKNKHRAFF